MTTQPSPSSLDTAQVTLTSEWADVTRLPAVAANQLLVQIDVSNTGQPASVLLTFGHASGPAIIGSSPEDTANKVAEFISSGNRVKIEPIARLSVSVARFSEFLQVMNGLGEKLGIGAQGGVQ